MAFGVKLLFSLKFFIFESFFRLIKRNQCFQNIVDWHPEVNIIEKWDNDQKTKYRQNLKKKHIKIFKNTVCWTGHNC